MKFITLLAIGATSTALAAAGWPFYGGDEGGQRFSVATAITPANVSQLVPAWRVRTGDLVRRSADTMRRSNFEATAVLAADRLLLCTPFNELIALDPGTGAIKWRYDAKIAVDGHPANGFTCRGIAAWSDDQAVKSAACSRRVFMGTNDGRLIALNVVDGQPCRDFGHDGEVKIDPGMALAWPGEFQITSPPVTLADLVIVGSSIGDNERVAAPRGTVRAFDARSGAPRWSFDPIPRSAADPSIATWGDGWKSAGQANVWAPMSVDSGRQLVFLPTSSPSPDFFGGLRPGDNAHSNSVVALHASDGSVAWAYQLVHHDLWDYDVPAQPTLATLRLPNGPRDVVIQGTKQGFLFVLDRATGEAVFRVIERPVPQNAVAGEHPSPTQPFPAHVPALVPQTLQPDDAFGVTPWDRRACHDAIAGARRDGLYAPPSEQGTILFPFTGGGINWGGIAFDPVHQIVFANTSRVAHIVTLFPAAQFEEMRRRFPGKEVSPQTGAPYGMKRVVLSSPLDLPCNPPPWGTLAAIDLTAGLIRWESRLGTTEEIAPLGIALHTGTPSFGGPLVTASGLVFIGSTMDRYLRAFDAATGEELWQGRLPATGQATPMTYEWRGRQYVVIAAGGHRDMGLAAGDSIVAFSLPGPGEAGPTLWSRTIDRPGGHLALHGVLVLLGVFGALALLRRRRMSARSN